MCKTSRYVAAIVIALLGLVLYGCKKPSPATGEEAAKPTESASPSHIIVIVLDALRADHLECYGYHRNTAPFICRLAQEGVLFEQALSNSSYTCESVASLFMGQYPSSNPWGAGWYARPNPGVRGIGKLFQEAGFKTGIFTTTLMLNHRAFLRPGFDAGECLASTYYHSRQAPKLTERALAFLKEHAGQRTFMYLHYMDPHSPYDPPDEYYLRFAEARYPDPLPLYEGIRPRVPELVAEGFGPGDPRFEDLVLRYDAEIAFVDDSLSKLFEGLAALGVLDDTLLVITSDHGEEFLDHGFVEHAWYLYYESLHIPLIFWWPKRLTPDRVKGWVSLVDLLPTLLELADIEVRRFGLDGAPIFEKDGDAWRGKACGHPIISELLIQMRSVMRSVVHGDHQYLAAQRWLTPADCARISPHLKQIRDELASGVRAPVDIWGPVLHEELYALGQDPEEKQNMLERRSPLVEGFRGRLETFRRVCPPQLPYRYKAARDASVLSNEEKEMLEALGYLGGAYEEGPAEGAANGAEGAMPTQEEERLKTLGYL